LLLEELERIDGECSKYDIDFVSVEDNEKAEEYGINVLPALMYFENKIPSMYDGDLMQEELVLEWLIEQKTTDTIEQVTDKVGDFLLYVPWTPSPLPEKGQPPSKLT